MPSTDQLQFEMQRRVILFNSGTTMPDNTVLGYEGNPNYASTATPGQTLLYNSPRGTSYIELVNGNLWYKQQIPNTWINLTSGTVSGTASTSSQNNVVFTTGNQDISGVKNFYSRPTVNGSGVLLIGETGSVVLPNTLVYTTGDQTINGLKDFTTRPTVNTIPVLLSGEVNTTISGVLYSAQINIKNDNGSTIYRGQPVYVSSAAGSNILVKLASNSGEQTSSKTLGLVYQNSLAQNAQGTIVTEGLLQGFNTNAGEEGDPIWLGPTGSLIFGLANKPYAPNHLVYLGVVTRKQANQGEVFVKIQNGFELDELHNVNINHRNALADKNIIRYDSLSGIWFNDTIDSVLPNSIVYITGNQTISGVKTFDVFPIVSGNKLITGVDLTSYATSANLYATGSALDNKINSLSGYVNTISAGGLLPNTIVYTSGDQIISGNKTFINNINVSGSGIFNALDLNNIDTLSLSGVDINITNGNVSLTNRPTVNGSGVVLIGELNPIIINTGSLLDNKINSLSGYVNSRDNVLGGQIASTGSDLSNKINSLSGLFTNYTGNLDATFATDIQLQNTGSILSQNINSLSGTLTGNYVTKFNGQFTNTPTVNGIPVLLSGQADVLLADVVYTTGDQRVSGFKTFVNSGLFLDGIKIGNNSIYITENRIEGGYSSNSNLTDGLLGIQYNGYFDGDPIWFNTASVRPIITQLSLSSSSDGYLDGTYTQAAEGLSYFTGDNGYNIYSYRVNPPYESYWFVNNVNNFATSRFRTFDLETWDHNPDGEFGSVPPTATILQTKNYENGIDFGINRGLINGTSSEWIGYFKAPETTDYNFTLNADEVAYFWTGDKALNGYTTENVDISVSAGGGSSQISTLNSGEYYPVRLQWGHPSVPTTANLSLSVVYNALYFYNFSGLFFNRPQGKGFYIDAISGNAFFGGNIQSNTATFNNRPTVNSIPVLLSGDVSNLPDTIVYTTGDQAISGSKTFDVAPIVSGNKLITGVDLSSYATISNLFSTGSILDNKITSLSGYIDTKDVIFSGQIASTGSNLNDKINSLSGWSASASDLANTGSLLDNKINALSGYVSGISAGGLLPNSIVYTTGNQTISGNKTFVQNTVFGDSSQGDFLVISGNTFTLYGSGNFTNGLFVSGVPVLTGIDLNSYATKNNLNLTGSILDNKINSLSGYVTGITGTFGSLATNLVLTGSILDSKINSLSGYVNSQDVIFSGQTFNTGSRLDNKINSLSGYVNTKDTIFSGQIASTGSNLYNSILSLSGYVSGISAGGLLPNSIVYITGNQTISGTKTFANNLEVQGTGIFNALDLSNISEFNFSGTNINLINGNVNISGGTLYISGNAVLTGVNLNAYATTANLFATGSTLNNKINSLSGYVDSKSIVLPTTIVYTTGNQTISGTKNFAENVIVGDETQDDLLIISGNKIIFGLNPTVNGTGIVYNQGDQTISGIKTFTSRPTVNGTGVLLIGEASAITLPTTIVYTTGNQLISGNKTFLNNIAVSGTGDFNSVKVSNIDKLFLSGIDIVVTGNSSINVYNAIYISGNPVLTGVMPSSQTLTNVVFTTGNQVISGNKTFLNNIAVSGTGSFNAVKVSSIDKLFLSGIDIVITGNSSINVYNAIYISGNPVLTGIIPTTQTITNVVYTTGDQLISGNKTFLNNVNISGTGSFNAVKVSSIDKLFLSGIDIIITGNSSINVYNNIYISGNPVLTGSAQLDSYATIANLFTTGSTLNNKINSLSGYVNSQDLIFSGKIASTGSNLYNSIISLSGYVDSKSIVLPTTIVFTTGNQTISGNKNFAENVIVGDETQDNLLIISGNKIIFGVYPTVNATGIVYDQGDQIISGVKTFTSRPKVNNSGIALQNDGILTKGGFESFEVNSNYGAGNVQGFFVAKTTNRNDGNLGIATYQDDQTTLAGYSVLGVRNGDGFLQSQSNNFRIETFGGGLGNLNASSATFTNTPNVNGEKVVLSGELNSTGIFLNNKINSLSGYVNSQDIIFSGQTFNTGSRLDNKINSLSGYITGITGIFGTLPANLVLTGSILNDKINSLSGYINSQDIVFSGQTSNTGSRLDTKINSLSGYVNSQNVLFSGQTASTGSILDNKINSLSGYVNSQDIIFSGQIASSGTRLDNKINSLSGYVNTQDVVFSGQTFNTGSRLDNKINSLSGYLNSQNIIFSGQIASTGSNLYNSILSLSGLFTGYTGSLDNIFATDAHLFTTGSNLDNKINSLSGYVNSRDIVFSGQTFNTGSRLDNKINSLSGYINSPASNIVFTTGNQKISGDKNFVEDVIFGDQTQDNLLVISGNRIIFGVYPTVNGTGIVYDQGNQIISGIKTFDVAPILSGNRLITGVDLSSYATITNLFNTGSRLDNKINSLSGYVNSQDTVFSGQTFNTGSRLDNKINSLSGYVNSQDIIFSGQTFNTGSRLDNKINSLSGYVNSQDNIFSGQTFNTGSRLNDKINSLSGYVDSKSITLPTTIVYITGDQIISGNKTFINNIAISGTGNFNSVKISSIDKLFLSGVDIVITGNSSINVYNAIYISGNPVLTGVLPNTQSISNVVYTTGNQLISGNKTFLNNISVSGTGDFNNVKVSSIDKLFLSGIDIVVTGNSSINVYNAIYISGNQVLTGVDLSKSYPANNPSGFITGVDLKNYYPDLLNFSNNFYITGTQNSKMILANSSTTITGMIVSGNPVGYNTSITQVGIGQIYITGSGNGITVNSYLNQYKTAGQFAVASLLHTGNNKYILYGNLST